MYVYVGKCVCLSVCVTLSQCNMCILPEEAYICLLQMYESLLYAVCERTCAHYLCMGMCESLCINA